MAKKFVRAFLASGAVLCLASHLHGQCAVGIVPSQGEAGYIVIADGPPGVQMDVSGGYTPGKFGAPSYSESTSCSGHCELFVSALCLRPVPTRFGGGLVCRTTPPVAVNGGIINFVPEAPRGPNLAPEIIDPPSAQGNVKINYEFPPTSLWNSFIQDGFNGIPFHPPTYVGSVVWNLAPGNHQIWGAAHCFGDTIINLFVPPPTAKPNFSFVPPPSTRVLTHKYRVDDAYPSPLQTDDAKIRVDGLLRNSNGTPAANKTVYLRLLDPPDEAKYVVNAGDARPDDNFDGPGILNGQGTTISTTSDADGKVSIILGTAPHAAGDNYQIEASLHPAFDCTAAPCVKSDIYTAWKRVYVEYNKMFRRGAYITDNVAPGAKTLEVSDVNVFPQPPFQLRIVHAPRVMGTGPVYSEIVTITDRDTSLWPFGTKPGKLRLNPDPAVPGVQHAYFIGEDVGPGPTYRSYLADAVGLVTGNRAVDYSLLDAKLVNRTFDAAFVEYVWLTDASAGVDRDLDAVQPRVFFDGVLPYERLIDKPPEGYQSEWLARKWMRHAQRVGQERESDSNHLLVFTATNHASTHGFNRVGSNFNDLWLFVKQIGNSSLLGEALIHELGHEWRVNQAQLPGVSTSGGHCNTALGSDQRMWDRTLKCTMHSTMYGDPNDFERSDGIVGFHYVRVGQNVNSEYLRIRRRDEPVPQNDNQRPPPK